MFSQNRFYHLIFPTYKRKPLLGSTGVQWYVDYIINTQVAPDVSIIIHKVLTDHIHLLIDTEHASTFPDIVKKIKGRTTYYFYKQFSDYELQLGKKRLWAKGYHFVEIKNIRQFQHCINYIANNRDHYHQ